jgi:hypothetical protein
MALSNRVSYTPSPMKLSKPPDLSRSHMEMFSTLFETAEERAVAHAYAVISGKSPDGLKPSARQLSLLRTIADRRGKAKAISVGRLAEMEKTSPREIKGDVRDLRLTFKVRIGSSRDGEAGGYYLITTKDEAFDTARPFIEQAKGEWAIINAILEPHELKELEGQLRLAKLPSAADLDAASDEESIRLITGGAR